MRCRVGEKTLRRYRQQTGLPIHHALVRGGENHSVMLCLDDGSIKWLHKDGTLVASGVRWAEGGKGQ